MGTKKTESNRDLSFFTFGTESNNQPIFTEAGRKQWINYGDDNQYNKYLVDLLNKSAKHNAIIKRTADMTASQGWEETTTNQDFITNGHGTENLNKIVYKNSYDLMVYGMWSVLVTWSKDKTKIARIKYMDGGNTRIVKYFDEKENPKQYKKMEDGLDFYYYSADWSPKYLRKNQPKIYQQFTGKYNGEDTEMIFYREYRPGISYYTLPSYIGAMDWISIDSSIAEFHLNSANNGFTPSMAINFKGSIPSKEQRDTYNRQLKESYLGSENAGKVIITYSENADDAPDILPISNNADDKRFIELENVIASNMAIGELIPPILIGIQQSGKLGSTSEINDAESLFQRNVINGKQFNLEEIYNIISKINGAGDMKLKTTEPLESSEAKAEFQIAEELDSDIVEEVNTRIDEKVLEMIQKINNK